MPRYVTRLLSRRARVRLGPPLRHRCPRPPPAHTTRTTPPACTFLHSYIEACESGSIFEGLLEDDLRIYATTAANAHESSWGAPAAPSPLPCML